MARKLGPGPFLATAAFFGIGVTLMGILIHYGAQETDRIINTGKRATATITNKEIDPGGPRRVSTYWIDYSIEGMTSTKHKQVRKPMWDSIKVGDKFVYYYDAEEPEFGFSEPEVEMGKDVSGWFLWGSVLVVPFLIIALVLWLRQRKA